MGRMPEEEPGSLLLYRGMEYASLPADWVFLLDEGGKLAQIFLSLQVRASREAQTLLEDFHQVDAYLASILGLSEPDPPPPPPPSVGEEVQSISVTRHPQGMIVYHILEPTPDGFVHQIYFQLD